MKGTFRRIGMTAVPAGNEGRDALMSVRDGARFVAEIGYDIRSRRSHNHFFAQVAEAWQQLPENLADEFASPEHLRKWALIKAGFRDERKFVASSPEEAQSIAAFIAPMDDYAVITVSGCVVTVYTAQSQSIPAMGGRDFQASKNAVFEVIARLIGVTTDELSKQAPLAPEPPAESDERELESAESNRPAPIGGGDDCAGGQRVDRQDAGLKGPAPRSHSRVHPRRRALPMRLQSAHRHWRQVGDGSSRRLGQWRREPGNQLGHAALRAPRRENQTRCGRKVQGVFQAESAARHQGSQGSPLAGLQGLQRQDDVLSRPC
jgi:hypothetical protein